MLLTRLSACSHITLPIFEIVTDGVIFDLLTYFVLLKITLTFYNYDLRHF